MILTRCLLLMFLGSERLKGHARSSMRTYVSAIKYVHQLLSIPDQTEFFLVQVLKGFSKEGHTVDIRQSITLPLLIKILDKVPEVAYTPYESMLFKAAFLLAYNCLLRVGENQMGPLCPG